MAGAGLYGGLQFGATFALAYYALIELHAGFGQILLALVPLLTLLLAVAEGQERIRLAAVGGSLLALAGVAIMSQDPSKPPCLCSRCSLRSGAPSASRRRRSSSVGCRRCIR